MILLVSNVYFKRAMTVWSPTVACPPAIPIAMAGERIGPEAVALFERYGVPFVEVIR